MSLYRHKMVQVIGRKFVCYTGMETDLIFNKGVELPEFAAYPLLESQQGRALIGNYYKNIIEFAQSKNVSVLLESVTWIASRDRAIKLNYKPDQLAKIHQDAIELMVEARRAYGDLPSLISANIGPREDAYKVKNPMSILTAQQYHEEQIEIISGTQADLVTAYTIGYLEEAIGMAQAAQVHRMPIVISFTVETDGRLPSGMELKIALKEVDKATNAYPLYYMINCAHPLHFEAILDEIMPSGRLKGLVVNASKCSHMVLDEATALDDGDPVSLGKIMRNISNKYSEISVLGGCCGTDLRHLDEMIEFLPT